eukprot:scaffold2831_cov330-Prasinococcus_capsulatus_cf.AAC.2
MQQRARAAAIPGLSPGGGERVVERKHARVAEGLEQIAHKRVGTRTRRPRAAAAAGSQSRTRTSPSLRPARAGAGGVSSAAAHFRRGSSTRCGRCAGRERRPYLEGAALEQRRVASGLQVNDHPLGPGLLRRGSDGGGICRRRRGLGRRQSGGGGGGGGRRRGVVLRRIDVRRRLRNRGLVLHAARQLAVRRAPRRRATSWARALVSRHDLASARGRRGAAPPLYSAAPRTVLAPARARAQALLVRVRVLLRVRVSRRAEPPAAR